MNQQNQKIKKELKIAIIISLIPILNYLSLIAFPKFFLAERARGRFFALNWTAHMFDDKKKRWVSLGANIFLISLCFVLFFVSEFTNYNIILILVYLFPMISTLPLFLYDWNKYVIKGEPWPNE